jgi:hypothetical protein
MLDQGKELDWFNSREIIILTIVAVVSLSFLIVWELTDDNPIVDLSLFKSRNFTIGCLCISLAYMNIPWENVATAALWRISAVCSRTAVAAGESALTATWHARLFRHY